MVSLLIKLGDKLRNYTRFVPLLLMELNIFGAAIFMRYWYFKEEPYWLTKIDLVNNQISCVSGIVLLYMLCCCNKWKFTAWLSYYCLVALWIVNTVYRVSEWDADIYFVCIVTIIDSLFVALSVGKLAKLY